MPNAKKYLVMLGLIVMVALILASCSGTEGPEGPPGPEGAPGEASEAMGGAVSAEYVGSASCAECHEGTYNKLVLSGHPYKLNKVVDGQPPEYPFSEVLEVPAGYTWDDISYVIGGYNWKARFIDQEGYIITGDADATTQYNFPNDEVGKEEGWVGYHAGEENKPYDCGSCHTTGYNPDGGNQDGLARLIGTWAEPGIQCEECHGPGGNHVGDPYGVLMTIDRDAQACGNCHIRGSVDKIDASSGFTKHHEQAEELYTLKHLAIGCVACHDPHTSAVNADDDFNPNKGIWNDCQDCHFDKATN